MDYAVDEMNAERSFIFSTFAVGVLATLGCLFSAAWVLMETEVAIVASILIISTMYMIISEARRIAARFMLEPDEGVSFGDLKSIFPRLSTGKASHRGYAEGEDVEDYPLLTHAVKDTKV